MMGAEAKVAWPGTVARVEKRESVAGSTLVVDGERGLPSSLAEEDEDMALKISSPAAASRMRVLTGARTAQAMTDESAWKCEQ